MDLLQDVRKKKLVYYGFADSFYDVNQKALLYSNDKYKISFFVNEVQEAIKLYWEGKVDGILISASRADFSIEHSVWGLERRFRESGISDIFVVPATLERKGKDEFSSYDRKHYISSILDFSEPIIVKFLAAEQCNLNCAGCTHFASINPEPKLLSVDELEKSLSALKDKFHYIRFIEFLGGEPLLNSDLDKLIIKVNEIFPYTQLRIITNGLLLPTVSDSFLQVCCDLKVHIDISLYQPINEMANRIRDKLANFPISYRIWDSIDNFRLQYNTNGNQNPVENHKRCGDWVCHTVRGGMIGGCYYAVMADIANQRFGTHIPCEQYRYDIFSEEYTGAQLLRRLISPSPLCAYCNGLSCPTRPWHQVGDTPDVNDWFCDK